MKTQLAQILVNTIKIKRQHIQLFITLLTLALLVLGAGAPDNGGLVGH